MIVIKMKKKKKNREIQGIWLGKEVRWAKELASW